MTIPHQSHVLGMAQMGKKQGGKRPAERPPWQYLTQKPKHLICGVAHPGEVVFVPAGWKLI